MIRFSSSGDFSKTRKFLTNMLHGDLYGDLDRYGREGVDALSKATPKDSQLTSQSWEYRIVRNRYGIGIEWHNTNIQNGSPIAILIQYGHGTGTGGYVRGRDYINPAIQPVFDKIADNVWKKVKE